MAAEKKNLEQLEAEAGKTVMVYIGRRLDGVKTVYGWIRLDGSASAPGRWAEHLDDSTYLVYQKVLTEAGIGSVIEFKTDVSNAPKMSIYTSKTGPLAPRYLGHWTNKENLTAWQLADGEIAQLKARQAATRKNAKAADQMATLEPFRLAYQRASTRAERAAILAQIIEYVTGQKRD